MGAALEKNDTVTEVEAFGNMITFHAGARVDETSFAYKPKMVGHLTVTGGVNKAIFEGPRGGLFYDHKGARRYVEAGDGRLVLDDGVVLTEGVGGGKGPFAADSDSTVGDDQLDRQASVSRVWTGSDGSSASAYDFASSVIVSFDLETTGLSPSNDHIVQLSATCGSSTFNEYVYTAKKINAKASLVTGITAETIAGKPEFGAVCSKFLAWLANMGGGKGGSRSPQKKPVLPVLLVAHNGLRFDFPLLLHEMQRHGIPPSDLEDKGGVKGYFDTLAAARHAFKGLPSHRLALLYTHVTDGKEMEDAHDALANTKALHEIASDVRVQAAATLYTLETFMAKVDFTVEGAASAGGQPLSP